MAKKKTDSRKTPRPKAGQKTAAKSKPAQGKTALIAGASGLTGGHCLEFLLDTPYYNQVHALVRRPLSITHPKLSQHVVDFDDSASIRDAIKADDIFCCLGTTIKKAGSQEAFRKVDFTYPVTLAREAASRGSKRYFIITAMGSNPRSRIFYNRVKGEVEAAVRALPYESVHIFRPSLLLGDRQEVRAAEKIGSALARILNPLMAGPLRPYRAIQARAVAWAMVYSAIAHLPGGVMESREIQAAWDMRR
ncbi:MAG: oxidoreductase [Spirochaetes bacterium]|nr:oxidoreductase [Spirochaetota bacterium]